jgi:1-acyl-sn-glycerol-3-phosphate acyltransferase
MKNLFTLWRNPFGKKSRLFRKNPFDQSYAIKGFLYVVLGAMTWRRMAKINNLTIKNGKILDTLPQNGVLFVSNHQTYFADVIAILHTIFSCKWGLYHNLDNPIYLTAPRINCYFVAAEETMKEGIIPKIFALGGAITVKRTWRAKGQDVNRQVDMRDISKMKNAIDDGWVITFPQGTTRPYAPGRRGTAHIIKETRPVVVPVVINGFRRAFDKKGLMLKKRGTDLSITIKEPLNIDFTQSSDEILALIMDAIEQSPKFNDMERIKQNL